MDAMVGNPEKSKCDVRRGFSEGNDRAVPTTPSMVRASITLLRSEVDPQWAFERRKEYLKGLMTDLIVDWFHLRSLHSDYVRRGLMIDDMLVQDDMRRIVTELLKHRNEIFYRREAMSGKEVRVTDDDIRRAREHPWEELLPFVRGKALCPFHEDHHPSFSVKDGIGHCWSCGWRGDTIDFWMAKNGRNFAEAVRSLS